MRRVICFVILLLVLPSCKNVLKGKEEGSGGLLDAKVAPRFDEKGRKVLAGRSTAGASDYRDGQGSSSTGGEGFEERFRGGDLFNGYGQHGLNAMSNKMVNQSLATKQQKSFNQTKNFLTRRYGGNTRELDPKSSVSERVTSFLSGKKSRDEELRVAGLGQEYRTKAYGVNASRESERAARTETYHGAAKTAAVKDYLPATKEQAGDMQPKYLEGSPGDSVAVSRFMRNRNKQSPVTQEEIRSLIGKKDQ